MIAIRRPIHAGFVPVALAAMWISACGHHAARVSTPLAPARVGSTETGIASWYGFPYDGRRAASGEIYDMRQLTAAHRRLPFQTWVEVTNLSNGKQVDVRINDRGPFVKGRVLDLSQAAARDIDMLRAGTARVRLKVIPPPNPSPDIPPRTPPSTPPSTPPNRATHEAVEITAAPAAPPDTPAATVPPATATTPALEPAVTTPSIAPPLAAGYAVQAGAFSDPARAESLRSVLADLFVEARVAPSNGRMPPLWRVIVGHEMTREQAAELAIRVRRETGSAIVVLEPGSTPAATPDSAPKN
jgi:rare lipoprotein A